MDRSELNRKELFGDMGEPRSNSSNTQEIRDRNYNPRSNQFHSTNYNNSNFNSERSTASTYPTGHPTQQNNYSNVRNEDMEPEYDEDEEEEEEEEETEGEDEHYTYSGEDGHQGDYQTSSAYIGPNEQNNLNGTARDRFMMSSSGNIHAAQNGSGRDYFNGHASPYSRPTTTAISSGDQVPSVGGRPVPPPPPRPPSIVNAVEAAIRRSFSRTDPYKQVDMVDTLSGTGYKGGQRFSFVKECFDSLIPSSAAGWDSDLLISKAFYFFFFSSFGSLYPMLGLYYKQLGFSPTQTGLVMGFRPFVELCSAPIWGAIAERYQRAKHILLFSLICWIVFTLSVAFVVPKPAGCVIFNTTHRFFEDPIGVGSELEEDTYNKIGYGEPMLTSPIVPILTKLTTTNMKTTVEPSSEQTEPIYEYEEVPEEEMEEVKPPKKHQEKRLKRDIDMKYFFDIKRKGHRLPKGYVLGKSPIVIPRDWLLNYPNRTSLKRLVKPTFSNVLYDEAEVQRAFLINLMLMIVGEFFSSPSLPLADTATMGYLGHKTQSYGKQRMFGSLGWGLAMFFVGIALDHSTAFPMHPCGQKDPGEKNYTICFAVFSVLMSFAFLAASQFYFKYQTAEDILAMKEMITSPSELEASPNTRNSLPRTVKAKLPSTVISAPMLLDDEELAADESYSNDPILKTATTPSAVENQNFDQDESEKTGLHSTPPPRPTTLPGIKSVDDKELARRARQNDIRADLPSWIAALKAFNTPYHGLFLFIAFFMGLGMGFVFSFLFWHLQDIGGAPTVFGIASIINHVSELVTYLFSQRMMHQLGHIKILYLGLAGNMIRFLYISWLKSPWWVLPFEFIQGLTHAAVWIACMSFVTHTVPIELKQPSQSLLQAIHHGLGRGLGAILGGVLIQAYGSKAVFRLYGIMSLVLLLLFFVAHKYFAKTIPFPRFSKAKIFEEQTHMDPQGLPINPISRDVSRNFLTDFEEHPTGPPINLANYDINRLTPIYKMN